MLQLSVRNEPQNYPVDVIELAPGPNEDSLLTSQGAFSVLTTSSPIAYRVDFTVMERLKSSTRYSLHLVRSDVSVFESNLQPRFDAIPPSSRPLTMKLI